MSKYKIEEFRGDHNKLYLTMNEVVFDADDINKFIKIAKSRFKVANYKLTITFAYIVGNELYLHYYDIPNSKMKKARFVYTAFVLN